MAIAVFTETTLYAIDETISNALAMARGAGLDTFKEEYFTDEVSDEFAQDYLQRGDWGQYTISAGKIFENKPEIEKGLAEWRK